MGILERLNRSDEDKDPLVEDTSEEETSSSTILGEDEFDVDLEDMEPVIKQGKELHRIENKPGEEGRVFAGEWPRKLFEGARREPRQPIWIGYTEPDPLHGPREVPIDFNSQFRHVALFGSTGYGKSTILKNMMIQWAYGDHGFCYIDPKGDDAKELIQILPEERLDDVIWIEPSPNDFDKVVGINFLDPSKSYGEDGFEDEVGQIISDIIPILRDESFWGPRMNEVVRGFLRAMLYLDDNYTLVDLYHLLTDQEVRQDFAEKVETELAGEDILQNALQKFAEIDDKDLASARRRLHEWVVSKEIQQVIAHTESKVNITKAVEDGKILVVRTASISDDSVKRGVATVVIRRIWTAIKMREELEQQNREPFFLAIDEFDDVVSSESDIGKILSKARSLKLGTVLANQQPHQLPGDIQENVLGNCNTLLALNPKNPDDAGVISRVFDADYSDIINLGRFQIATQIEVGGEPSEVFRTQTFPEYPPKRSREKAMEIIRNIVEEYGVDQIHKSTDDIEGSKFGAEDVDPTKREYEINDKGDEMSIRAILRAIYTAQIQNGGPEKFVGVDDVEDVVEKKTDAPSYNKVANILTEKVDDAYIEKRLGEDVEIRLSKAGQQKAFTQDTGKSASSGKQTHRYYLQLVHEAFTRLGYEFEAPKQVGGEQPDGIAEPPINPRKEGESIREIQKLIDKFEDEYPTLAERFGYDELNIEVEKSTSTKPKQVLKNLKKSVESGRDCVFVVPDGGNDGLASNADTVYNILKNPPYVSRIIEEDDKNYQHLYNMNTVIKIPDRAQMYAAKPDEKDTVWKKDPETGEIILENPQGGEEYARFENAEALENANPEDFPYTYTHDKSQQAVIVTDRDGNEIEKFTSTEDKTPRESMESNGFKRIKEPVIPEQVFPGDELPTSDQWHIIVIPESERKIGPKYYDKDERNLVPLFEDDTPLSSDKIPDPDDDALEKAEQPPVADPEEDSPKSLKDVIEESDEVWTKPKPGDDEYNPAKDNTRHEVDHKDGHQNGDWNGGQARDIDEDQTDFEEYEVPENKKEDKEKETQTNTETKNTNETKEDEEKDDITADKTDENTNKTKENVEHERKNAETTEETGEETNIDEDAKSTNETETKKGGDEDTENTSDENSRPSVADLLEED